MIGQGHQIFVDELQRFAAAAADSRCAAIADRLAAPLRVAVSGRRGVGRSTVAEALAGAAHSHLTVTTSAGSPEADLEIYVLADVVKPEDHAAITSADRPVLAVLNKADLIATTQPGRFPDGPTHAARDRCAELSARTGLPIEPVVALLAVAALRDAVDDALWAALQVLAAGQSVASESRRRLLDTLDVFGVEQAVTAIRGGATRHHTRAAWRRLSCIDEVVDSIGAVGAQVRYQRLLDAVAELQALAVTDARVGEFLIRDDAVVARMAAAVDVVEAAGMKFDRCRDAEAYLRLAVGWQRYRRGPVAGLHRACGTDIVRGSLRLWSKAGSHS